MKKKFNFQKKTKLEIFNILFHYWLGKLGIEKAIKVRKDNRYDGILTTEKFKSGKIEVVCNLRKLSKWNIPVILLGIFHEIGHIILELPYNTIEEQVHSEYLVEIYALKMIKKFYPEYLKELIMHTKYKLSRKKWRRENTIHYQAFSLIEDYK